jgi:hypothetical protein
MGKGTGIDINEVTPQPSVNLPQNRGDMRYEE